MTVSTEGNFVLKPINPNLFVAKVFESNNLNSTVGFCLVVRSLVTTGGFILIGKSAFLLPNEADNCSCVKPSTNADCLVTMAIDAKVDKKTTTVAIITAVILTIEDETLRKLARLRI
jgi:hypothetical protein